MRHAELRARRTYWMAASFRRFQHGGFTMPRSPWVTRALSAALPSKSHDPFVQVGHEEASPELPQFDPYLASLLDEYLSPEPFQPADWLPEKWATRPSQED